MTSCQLLVTAIWKSADMACGKVLKSTLASRLFMTSSSGVGSKPSGRLSSKMMTAVAAKLWTLVLARLR
jgi:hypothetical protein